MRSLTINNFDPCWLKEQKQRVNLKNEQVIFSRNIWEYMESKGYTRDVQNNKFIKKISNKFNDFIEVCFIGEYVCFFNGNLKHKILLSKLSEK